RGGGSGRGEGRAIGSRFADAGALDTGELQAHPGAARSAHGAPHRAGRAEQLGEEQLSPVDPAHLSDPGEPEDGPAAGAERAAGAAGDVPGHLNDRAKEKRIRIGFALTGGVSMSMQFEGLQQEGTGAGLQATRAALVSTSLVQESVLRVDMHSQPNCW